MADFRFGVDPGIRLDALEDGLQHNLGWNDNLAYFSMAKGNGTTEPVWSNMGNGLYNMLFTPGDELMVSFHVNHDYALTTKAYPHIHWLIDTVPTVGQTVVWEIAYIVAKGHGQGQSLTDALTTFQVTYTATGTEIAGEHLILECSDAQAFDILEPDTMVEMKVKLISRTVTGDIFGIMADLHYQSDREDTISKVPDFNVPI